MHKSIHISLFLLISFAVLAGCKDDPVSPPPLPEEVLEDSLRAPASISASIKHEQKIVVN